MAKRGIFPWVEVPPGSKPRTNAPFTGDRFLRELRFRLESTLIAAVPAAPIAARNLPFIWLLEEKAGAVRRLAGFRCESEHLSSVQTPRLQSLARLDSVHNVA